MYTTPIQRLFKELKYQKMLDDSAKELERLENSARLFRHSHLLGELSEIKQPHDPLYHAREVEPMHTQTTNDLPF